MGKKWADMSEQEKARDRERKRLRYQTDAVSREAKRQKNRENARIRRADPECYKILKAKTNASLRKKYAESADFRKKKAEQEKARKLNPEYRAAMRKVYTKSKRAARLDIHYTAFMNRMAQEENQ